METKKTLLEMLLEAGYPEKDIFHHCSDLYVYVTPLTTKVIDEWCKSNGFRKDWHCPKFKDQITGRPMYDCAFQYYDMVLPLSLKEKQGCYIDKRVCTGARFSFCDECKEKTDEKQEK